MFCPNCGNQIPDGAKFCAKCGWQVGTRMGHVSAGEQVKGAATAVTDRLNQMAGGTGHVDLKFSDFFDQVPKHHSAGEADELFSCGAPNTTPALKDVASAWPHPWVWSRVAFVLGIAAILLYYMVSWFSNPNGIPGFIFVGSAAMPLAALTFFFEANVYRNISFAQVLKVFLMGGIASILAALIIGETIGGSGTGALIPAMLTGLFEEAAKFLIVAYILSKRKGRNYVLAGLLIGAGVGAGFAVFESAGYAFRGFLSSGIAGAWDFFQQNYGLTFDAVVTQYGIGTLLRYVYMAGRGALVDRIITRGILSFGGHVAWAAVEGGALALAESGDEGFQWSDLLNKRFLGFAAICIVCHGIWDTTVPGLDDIDLGVFGDPKYILLIIAIWVVIIVMLNRGLEQANEVSKQAQQAAFSQMGAYGPGQAGYAYAQPAAAQGVPAQQQAGPNQPVPPVR